MTGDGSRGSAATLWNTMFTWLLLLALALPVAAPPAKAKTKPLASHAARVSSVTLAIRHRVFKQFSDVQTIHLDEEFPVGDTEFSARVIRYVPDFAMDLTTRAVISRSTEPNNPAFEVVVREKDVPQDTTWAFLNMPPHFARKSLLAFKIARIDFIGRDPILADTTHATRAAESEPAKP